MNLRKSSSEQFNGYGSREINSEESAISRINSYTETIFGRIFCRRHFQLLVYAIGHFRGIISHSCSSKEKNSPAPSVRV